MKTPVTKQTLRTHFTYSWWKYALLAVLAVFGIDLLYTVTAALTFTPILPSFMKNTAAISSMRVPSNLPAPEIFMRNTRS